VWALRSVENFQQGQKNVWSSYLEAVGDCLPLNRQEVYEYWKPVIDSHLYYGQELPNTAFLINYLAPIKNPKRKKKDDLASKLAFTLWSKKKPEEPIYAPVICKRCQGSFDPREVWADGYCMNCVGPG
jgi:hypothetical protein